MAEKYIPVNRVSFLHARVDEKLDSARFNDFVFNDHFEQMK